jgi:hypothetical protein
VGKYRYKASETFWRKFYALSAEGKEQVRKAWEVFKSDPFASSLGTHKIHALSARAGRTVWSVVIAKDLRAVFFIEGDTVNTFDIGTHSVYR